MTKRAAMTFAGLVAAALLAGAGALAGWVGGPAPEGAAAAEPIVRTVERTITVHRRAEPSPGAVRVVELPAPAAAPPAWDDDQGFEDEHEGPGDGHEDERPEDGEEHEDD